MFQEALPVLDRARGDRFVPRDVDWLIQAANEWTPREASVFLLEFEVRFRLMTGRIPNNVEKLILTSLLRRRATASH